MLCTVPPSLNEGLCAVIMSCTLSDSEHILLVYYFAHILQVRDPYFSKVIGIELYVVVNTIEACTVTRISIFRGELGDIFETKCRPVCDISKVPQTSVLSIYRLHEIVA